MFCFQVEVYIDDEAKLTLQGVAAPCHLLVCSIQGSHTFCRPPYQDQACPSCFLTRPKFSRPRRAPPPRLSTPLKSLRCVDWVWGLIVAYIVWWFWWFQFQNILKYFEIYKIFWNILKYIAWCCWWFHCSWILFQQKCCIIAYMMMILMVSVSEYFEIFRNI